MEAGDENVLVTTINDGLAGSFQDTGAATTPGTPPDNNTAFVSGLSPIAVQGNRIGTDIAGILAVGNVFTGVDIVAAPNNVVGGTAPGARNLISGNGGLGDSGIGVNVQGVQSTGTLIQGNYIGTDITGGRRLGNLAFGVFLQTVSNTTVGGTAPGAGNVISGNATIDGGEAGVALIGQANHNTIQGNLIGTDATGRVDLGNGGAGILLGTGSSDNMIGGASAAARNVIGANGFGPFGPAAGIVLNDADTDNNTMAGNFIGVDVTGAVALGNSLSGVLVNNGPSSNTIGGVAAGAGNIISGNKGEPGSGIFGDGVIIRTASNNVLLGNRIGLDVSGTIAIPNQGNGVYSFMNADGNIIGNSSVGNVISANGLNGILIQDSTTSGNTVQGNVIGLSADGSVGLGNKANGVELASSPNNKIGGGASGAANSIAANTGSGVLITSLLTSPLLGALSQGFDMSLPAGTYFYVITAVTATGETTASAERSITVPQNSSVNLSWVPVGGATGYKIYRGPSSGAENVLVGTVSGGSTASFADGGGATQPGSPPTTNTALGGDASGNQVLGNQIGTGFASTRVPNGDGIEVVQSSHNVIGGSGDGEGNQIVDNNGAAVTISGSAASNNVVQANYVSAFFDETGSITNTFNGVQFLAGASNNIVGGASDSLGNTINFNGGSGVLVASGSVGDAILTNSISDNNRLGIELQSGANHNQPAPVITSAIDGQGTTFIMGTATGPANSTLTLQFFTSFDSDDSQSAQGDQFLDQLVVQTNAAGQASFSIALGSPFFSDDILTATATDAQNNTSQFSAGVPASDNPFADLTVAMYTQVLERPPSVGDVEYWVGQLGSGVSRLVMSQTVWESPEHRLLQVDGYYEQYLNREADSAGLQFFATQLVLGVSEIAVQVQLLVSPEYASTHPTFDAYLIGLYQNILGRDPDALGVGFWRLQAALGATRADVALAFLTSDEAYSDVLNSYYEDFLERPIDTPSEVVLLAQLRAGQATTQSIAEGILASDEYFALASSMSGPIFD